MDMALVAARDAVEAFPHSAMAQGNLTLVAMYASDFETAISQAEKVIADHPGYETAYVGLGLSHLALGDTAAAIVAYGRLAGVSDWGASLAASGRADIAIYEGRLGDAITILDEAASIDLEGGNKAAAATKLFTLARAALTRDRKEEAAAAAKRAVQISQQEQVLFEAARVYLASGGEEEARRLATQLAERLAPEPRSYSKLIEGEIALANAEPQRAVTSFLEAQEILDTWIGRVSLGRAYLESGAFPEAHAELEVALARRGEAASVFLDDSPTYHYLPPVHYYLGRALEGLGSASAADSYRTFLEVKVDDGGDPLVADALERTLLR
jgi:tetratricopeptide (TPR) repeat protein